MNTYILLGIIAILFFAIIGGILFTWSNKISKLNTEVYKLQELVNFAGLELEKVNKSYAIIERIITPFMEWVNQVQIQQENVAKDAREKAEALFNPNTPRIARKKQ